MRISTLHRRIIAALSLLPTLAATVSAQVLDLGTLGTYPAGANALNSSGEVAGFYTDAGGASQAFRYKQGDGMQSLGDLNGTATATAYGINASGVIVGQAGAVGGTEAFRWTSGGGMQSLGTLGGANSVAYAVNDSGTIVGRSEINSSSDRGAFSWINDTRTALGTLDESNFSEARGISASGVIVGSSVNARGDRRAVRFSGGTAID
ncbi:MAG: hypothetical protein H7Y38_16320, partial [Armatimonadetes bacterium]|nr:hypothetical protein [Armatimonadota bacterium]